MNSAVHDWLKIAEVPARWTDLEPNPVSTELLEKIEARIAQSTQAIAALAELDLSEPENTNFPLAIFNRRRQFATIVYGTQCQKSRTPRCQSAIIREGFCHLRAAEQALRVHQQYLLPYESNTIIDAIHQPVYDTILVFHEMIHRYLRVRESK